MVAASSSKAQLGHPCLTDLAVATNLISSWVTNLALSALAGIRASRQTTGKCRYWLD